MTAPNLVNIQTITAKTTAAALTTTLTTDILANAASSGKVPLRLTPSLCQMLMERTVQMSLLNIMMVLQGSRYGKHYFSASG